MIRFSDNRAADAVHARLGLPALTALAHRAGMRSFFAHPVWGGSLITADDQARYFRERLIELSRTRMGDSSDRSIDVLVSRVRRKLSHAGKDAPIITVRGVGYRFNDRLG